MLIRVRVSDVLRNAWLVLINRLRLLRSRDLGFVMLRLGGNVPERTPVVPRRPFPLSLLPWPAPPTSVESFGKALDRLAHDPRVRGIVLILSDLSTGPATLASLRQAIGRFRQTGKRAVAYLQTPDMWSCYLASVCDHVLAPESAVFRSSGIWIEALFLKDTLASIGIEADFVAIGEYKVSPDSFRRSRMTEPHREMLEALLDCLHGHIVGAISEGRGLSEERVLELLDAVPLTAGLAQEAGLLDGVCYEDELTDYLGESAEERPVLVSWEQAQKRLLAPLRWRSRQAVGVVSLQGLIVLGPSRRMPLPLPLPLFPSQAGSDTLVQQLRAAAQDKRLGAIVLHVDSPGGSALASDLIWREVLHLRRRKPVVVYMGDRAASGGYYVAAGANAVVAQPTTLTGSIGIWGGKIVTRGLWGMVHARREVAARGGAAGLYADVAPFTAEERAKIRSNLGAGYERFKSRVADGRGLTMAAVEDIARGRVWCGEQGLRNGLVDSLGDLRAAADLACELAGLDPDRYVPLVNVPLPRQHHVPASLPDEATAWWAGFLGLMRGLLALAPWDLRVRQ